MRFHDSTVMFEITTENVITWAKHRFHEVDQQVRFAQATLERALEACYRAAPDAKRFTPAELAEKLASPAEVYIGDQTRVTAEVHAVIYNAHLLAGLLSARKHFGRYISFLNRELQKSVSISADELDHLTDGFDLKMVERVALSKTPKSTQPSGLDEVLHRTRFAAQNGAPIPLTDYVATTSHTGAGL